MAKSSRLSARIRPFGFAARGLVTLLQAEYNARVHALATVIAVSTGFILGIDRLEWVALVLTIAAVWSLEAVNTAIEALCDLVSPEQHPLVEKAKDVAAGAVLVAALAALIVAGLIFIPRVIALYTT